MHPPPHNVLRFMTSETLSSKSCMAFAVINKCETAQRNMKAEEQRDTGRAMAMTLLRPCFFVLFCVD